MGFEGQSFDIEGVSPSFVEALYRTYVSNPGSVEPSWRSFFEGLEASTDGPSWKRGNWPPADTDPLTAALDPTQSALPPKADTKKPAPAAAPDQDAIARAAADSIRAMLLIRTYRVRGHLAAQLDPLGITKRDLPADLTPEYHGFSGADLDRPIYLGGVLGLQQASVREIVAILQRNYCGPVGLEYMHIADTEERRFLQERMEGKDAAIEFTPEGKKAILSAVIRGEQFEKFLG